MSKSTKPTRTKFRKNFPTGNAVLRAYGRAVKRIGDPNLTSTSSDAGIFMMPAKKGEPRIGYQVFVTIEAWSSDALKAYPLSGGLVSRAREMALDDAKESLNIFLVSRARKATKKKGGAK